MPTFFNSLFTFYQVLKKELIVVWGRWQGKAKPVMSTFLTPFLVSAQSLRKKVSIIILIIVTNNIVPKNKKLFKCVSFFSLSSKSFLF